MIKVTPKWWVKGKQPIPFSDFDTPQVSVKIMTPAFPNSLLSTKLRIVAKPLPAVRHYQCESLADGEAFGPSLGLRMGGLEWLSQVHSRNFRT